MLYGIAAYGLWGLFPLYWPLLKPAGALEILAHRIVWSLVAVVVDPRRHRHWTLDQDPHAQDAARSSRPPRSLITVNWGIYIYAVNSGHTIEAALGYFINPLVSVLLGVVVLRERLRPWQWAASASAPSPSSSSPPTTAGCPGSRSSLAVSFGTYGLLKKFAQRRLRREPDRRDRGAASCPPWRT